jgi:hypothetical protein
VVLALLLVGGAIASVSSQPATAGVPETCRVGINVEELYDLELSRDTFGAVLWLWSLCPSPQSAPLATIALPTGSNLDLGELRDSDAGAAGYYQYRRVQGTFRHDWDMRYYPFDRQHLVVPIDDTELGSAVVVFEPDIAASFVSGAIRTGLDEWEISGPLLEASVTREPSSYGLPGAEGVGYARLEATVVLERTQALTFLKLTAGVFAAALIALLSLFLDPRDRGSFASKLGVLAGVLFGVLLSMRAADGFIGDASRMTLVSAIHLVALVLIFAIALISLVERRRVDLDHPPRYPNWPLVAATAGSYVLLNLALVGSSWWQ